MGACEAGCAPHPDPPPQRGEGEGTHSFFAGFLSSSLPLAGRDKREGGLAKCTSPANAPGSGEARSRIKSGVVRWEFCLTPLPSGERVPEGG